MDGHGADTITVSDIRARHVQPGRWADPALLPASGPAAGAGVRPSLRREPPRDRPRPMQVDACRPRHGSRHRPRSVLALETTDTLRYWGTGGRSGMR